MKKSGAWLVRYALEQLGIRHTLGIPGVHNTEIYDELNKSESITPLLVTHEGGAAFMADAMSRTSDSIGTLLVVPAAGITHAASGIAEAHLDGIPMLVISGGVRTDGMKYQLHDMDQHGVLKPITKATFKVEVQADIISTLYRAYDIAMAGEPGPVFVEIPVNIALFKAECPAPMTYAEYCLQGSALPSSLNEEAAQQQQLLQEKAVSQAVDTLLSSKQVGLFLGWGCKEATEEAKLLAELLAAPVSTTLQGLSVFPGNHPLHVGMGFGAYSVPAAEQAFKQVDCVLACGTRFSEIPTGSFGMEVPEKLIHIDINSDVFSANYPAQIAIQGDAKDILLLIIEALKERIEAETATIKERTKEEREKQRNSVAAKIAAEKEKYLQEWFAHNTKDKVNPARFFKQLREEMEDDDFLVVDDGNHTFLAAELMPVHSSKHFISPTDFNCMGYCVPAAIGTKLANPDKQVVGIVGDGAFLMTCMELVTATNNELGLIISVFNDGELAQIAQAQSVPYNRKTCTKLGRYKVEGVAMATGCEYIRINTNEEIYDSLQVAFKFSQQGISVILDINIDYSKKTRFTQGIVKTNLQRFELSEKVRFISRAIKRKVMG